MDLVLLQPFIHTKGGLEKVVLEVARRYDPIIYTYRYVPEATFEEFREFDVRIAKPQLSLPASILPSRLKWGIQSGEIFWNLRIREDYDVVNAHGTPSEWARNHNPRMMWYCHTPNREAYDLYEWRMRQRSIFGKMAFWPSIKIFKYLEAKVAPKIEKICTNSTNSQARIRKYLGRESEIIYPGVDVNLFKCIDYEKFFFYPSRITPEKRFELAIEAFRRSGLHDRGFRIVIAGSLQQERKEHMQYYNYLCELVKGIGEVRANIPYGELKSLYSRCYAVMFTPVNEDFGIIPLEAMASEKPVIAIDEGGPRETVVHKRTGFLAKDADEMALYMNALASDVSIAEKMGRAGRKHVVDNFSWDNFFRKYEVALREAAGGTK